jgi:carbamate kinase
MLIVIALGGNALLQRGEPLEADLQKRNIKVTAKAIAKLAKDHQVVICHGNGPQVGLLALQAENYKEVEPYPLDVLDAETQGMIGYLIQQEIGNSLADKPVITLLTQVEVDSKDSAFKNPSKPIGPVYDKEQAERISKERGWTVAQDGKYFRRVVPSPQPKKIVELEVARHLVARDVVVIFGGGGGIPVIRNNKDQLEGVEAVIDKDNTASLIAEKLKADALLILTDVKNVCVDWGTSKEKSIKAASPELLRKIDFAKGSMGPKINASCRFVENTKKIAAIGNLSEMADIVEGKAGTRIESNATKISFYDQ